MSISNKVDVVMSDEAEATPIDLVAEVETDVDDSQDGKAAALESSTPPEVADPALAAAPGAATFDDLIHGPTKPDAAGPVRHRSR